MRRLRPGATLALALLCASAGPASAFSTIDSRPGQNIAWPRNRLPVAYQINQNGSDDLGGSEFDAVRASFQTWSGPACTFITFRDGGTTASTAAGVSDNANNVLWVERGWSSELGGSGTIGLTTPIYQPFDGTILDADIRFNGQHFTWTTSDSRALTDVATIATHEIGHLLGLDHTSSRGAVMAPASSTGQITRRLSSDDTRGVCFIYPIDGEEGSGCRSDTDCSGDLACLDTAGGRSCTRTCPIGATPDPCEEGFLCQDAGGAGACLPDPSQDGQLCAPCDHGGQCGAGFCVGTGDGGGICSRSCSGAEFCPSGYQCAALQGGGGACLPASGSCEGGGQSGPDPAAEGESCGDVVCAAGLLCIGSSFDDAICRRSCATNRDCGSGHTCAELLGGGGACIPGGGGGQGDQCSSPADCDGEAFCIDNGDGTGVCAEPCTPGSAASCPGGSSCLPLQGGGGACIGGGGLVGESCEDDFCAAGLLCIVGSDGAHCRRGCSAARDCSANESCEPLQGGGSACLPGAGGPVDPPDPVGEGEVCSAQVLCMDGMLCIAERGATSGRCLRTCQEDGDCYGGQECTELSGGAGSVCTNREGGSGGGAGGLGARCNGADDCNSASCIAAGGYSLCSRSCVPGDDTTCPSRYLCLGIGGGRGACWPQSIDPGEGFGAECVSGADCVSRTCTAGSPAGGICSEPCRDNDACPPGFVCAENPQGGRACLRANASGVVLGGACDGDGQCVAGLACFRGVCRMNCSGDGKLCPSGHACLGPAGGGAAYCVAQELSAGGGEESVDCASGCAASGAGERGVWLLLLGLWALRRRKAQSSVRSISQ